MSDDRDLVWRKSSRSTSGACVEVAVDEALVHIRDSKDPGGPVLTFDRAAFQDFIHMVTQEDLS
ncbi:MAG TPA: DUF397 domain-containing protein [Actinoplanes sp.]|nr:DUF397 domain-containing protein [Actinoplanes sp.]